MRARQPWELFVLRSKWKLNYDEAFVSEKKRKPGGVYVILGEAPTIAMDPNDAWTLLPNYTLEGEFDEAHAPSVDPASRNDAVVRQMRSR
eukprot:7416465-Heterocapsa_arctica.AAC.1